MNILHLEYESGVQKWIEMNKKDWLKHLLRVWASE
jgi:hypothetical protein